MKYLALGLLLFSFSGCAFMQAFGQNLANSGSAPQRTEYKCMQNCQSSGYQYQYCQSKCSY